ncbi:MAG: tetratricopeptide repeat protein [Pseudomonadales bacterium]|nr:tetratricopeptide repeat protein [Pseudomonadales bacterium]
MKRALIILVVVIIAFLGIGTLMERDPGYVLLSWNGRTFQTGIWVFLIIYLLMLTGGYYGVRTFRAVAHSSERFAAWREARRLRKARDLSARGQMLLQQGEYARAEKFLVSSAQHHDYPALNYIAAARAANAQGNSENREKYLSLAEEADAGDLAAIAAAEMYATGHDWSAVEKKIGHLTSPKALPLRQEALLQLREWQKLLDLLPQIRKTMDDQAAFLAFSQRIAVARLSGEGNTEETMKLIYQKLSGDIRHNPAVVKAYVTGISSLKDQESAIIEAIKAQWHDELVLLYADLGPDQADKRIRTLTGWRKQHADNWAVHYGLGHLYELTGDKAEARDSYEKSLAAAPNRQAHEALAHLQAFEGEYQRSNEHLKAALTLAASAAD